MAPRTCRHLYIVARRLGAGAAFLALRLGEETYVGEALSLRTRLVQRLAELQEQLAAYYSFTEPEAAELAERIGAMALAIEELDAFIRGEQIPDSQPHPHGCT